MESLIFYRYAYRLLLALVAISLSLGANASNHDRWEMRVCAEPYNFPVSSREQGGFNNDIARLLAEELGAQVSFEWTVLTGPNVERSLLSGTCDLIIGVAENAEGTLNTVPYLRVPYVFISKENRGIAVNSLDDPELERLRIGTYQTGIPSLALRNRGIEENVFEYAPVPSPGGPDRHFQVLEALMKDEIDVAIVYASAAAGHAAHEEEDFRIVPVTPEVDVGATLISLFRTWTIGVRPHDEAFRDRLNIALAERWNDIQQVIDGYGVPQLSLTRPTPPRGPTQQSIAVVAPATTGGHVPLESIGTPALAGAKLAESALAASGVKGHDLRVVYVSSPTEAAAVRAVERVIATESSFAIVGGFGEDEAARIAEIADSHQILFFNVASVGDSLRGSLCNRNTFHIEASASMYSDVLVDWFAINGARRFFVVHDNEQTSTSLAMRTINAIEGGDHGSTVVGKAVVGRQQFVYSDVINRIEEAKPDIVLLLLQPKDQEVFLSQYPRATNAPAVTGVPYSLTQTREYLFRFRDINSSAGTTARAALWEASLKANASREINESYLARNGAPMEPVAWATYSSLLILSQAVDATESYDSTELISYLEEPTTAFELGKGVELSFRPWNHQLRQPLFIVEVDETASWGRTATEQLEVARLVAQHPEGDDASVRIVNLDRFGQNAVSSSCRF